MEEITILFIEQSPSEQVAKLACCAGWVLVMNKVIGKIWEDNMIEKWEDK